jgi:hypothetical protein
MGRKYVRPQNKSRLKRRNKNLASIEQIMKLMGIKIKTNL